MQAIMAVTLSWHGMFFSAPDIIISPVWLIHKAGNDVGFAWFLLADKVVLMHIPPFLYNIFSTYILETHAGSGGDTTVFLYIVPFAYFRTHFAGYLLFQGVT